MLRYTMSVGSGTTGSWLRALAWAWLALAGAAAGLEAQRAPRPPRAVPCDSCERAALERVQRSLDSAERVLTQARA
ncbi:MAG: hypothetical protein IRY91_16745, partial [Gemmatimonadaceae bacterium]|nr:hypothetical protein [Gemmatimonadaceae bacterium]